VNFLLFLDNDDELTPDALGEIALYIAQHPETDVIYTDDDKIDTTRENGLPLNLNPTGRPIYSYHTCI
jgi:hypothetical protein